MRIVHIAASAPYNDYWGYQENILPKYQAKMGNSVTLITTNLMHKDGAIIEGECGDYYLNDGVRVIRLKKKNYGYIVLNNMFSKLAIFEILKQIMPDFIFFHGLVSTTIFDAIKYKKKFNNECVIVQDNHLDYNIGWKSGTLKYFVFKHFYRLINKKSINYVTKVYGVTPWRKKYAEDFFRIPPQKTDVLIMGADDEKINFSMREDIRSSIRERYGIKNTDFLIVTGGKIEGNKKIDILMEACINKADVKLLIFGNVANDLKEKFTRLIDKSSNLIYIGWINSDAVYDYFFASDLVFFPGQHSVLWEQACASKTPCVFAEWEGMNHVNNGGNSVFINPVTKENIEDTINSLKFTKKYYDMKRIAESSATDIYLYSKIAEKSLECAR